MMGRLVQSVGWLRAVLFLVLLTVPAASAAERSMTLLPGTDLPGFDYAVQKGVDAEACAASCTDDRICRAFTFNEKAGWCFLKGAAAEPAPEDRDPEEADTAEPITRAPDVPKGALAAASKAAATSGPASSVRSSMITWVPPAERRSRGSRSRRPPTLP